MVHMCTIIDKTMNVVTEVLIIENSCILWLSKVVRADILRQNTTLQIMRQGKVLRLKEDSLVIVIQ